MLLDYVNEYGHLAFSREPLNYLDLLAFAGLSYLDYPPECIGGTLHNALEDAHEPVVNVGGKNGEDVIVAMEAGSAEDLAHLVMKSSRYRLIHLKEFESSYSEGEQQFAAMALMIGDLLVVVYRGTDETVTGWEEALKLSLEEPVGAQVDAIKFLEKCVADTEGPIVVCGHSKGGNLAEFAATVLAGESEQVAGRIAAIVSFDGPGLAPTVRETEGYRRISDRIRTFIPGSGIVGNIFEHPDGAVELVSSSGVGFEQHLIYNWKTDGAHFATRRSQSIFGRIGSAALSGLIDNLNDDQKKGIFKAIFALPKAFGKKTL